MSSSTKKNYIYTGHLNDLRNELRLAYGFEGVFIGLARQAEKLIESLHENCLNAPLDDEGLKSAVVEALKNDHCTAIAITTNCYEQVALSIAYAELIGRLAGRVRPEEEYSIIQHMEPAASGYRVRAFEHFFGGNRAPVKGLLSMRNHSALYDDLACPLILDAQNKVVIYGHFIAPQNQLSLAHAWTLFDVSQLTPAQLRVLRHLLEEETREEIAKLLEISLRTLEKHIYVILKLSGAVNIPSLLSRMKNL